MVAFGARIYLLSAHQKCAHPHIRYRSIKLRDINPYKRENHVIYLLTIHTCQQVVDVQMRGLQMGEMCGVGNLNLFHQFYILHYIKTKIPVIDLHLQEIEIGKWRPACWELKAFYLALVTDICIRDFAVPVFSVTC